MHSLLKKSPPPRAQQTSSVVLNIHFNHSQISTKTGFEIHTGCKFNHIKKKGKFSLPVKKGKNKAKDYTVAGTTIFVFFFLKCTGAFATSNNKIIPEIELKSLCKECVLEVLLMLSIEFKT